MSAFTRPVMLLLTGLLLFTISMSVLNTLVPLWLMREELSTLQIGAVSSSYFLGNLIGTLVAGQVITRIGFNRGYFFACFVFIATTLSLGLSIGFVSWTVWRLFAGIACAVIWVIVESALLRSGSLSNRGLLLAAYMVIYYLGTVIGQILLNISPTLRSDIIPWTTALLLIALLPLLFTKFTKPNKVRNRRSLLKMFTLKSARLGISGCIISGIILGILYGLLPLYLARKGLSDGNVAYWMALLVACGILGQFPIGKLAEKYGRLTILKIQTLMIVVACVIALFEPTMIAPVLMILGCFGFTLYPLAMAWACEKVNSDEVVAMNQTLLLSYTLGSLAGPALTAMLMQNVSDQCLFIMIACAAMLYLTQLFYRTNHQQPLPI
jgi:UMF2 family putative MFS family transporter